MFVLNVIRCEWMYFAPEIGDDCRWFLARRIAIYKSIISLIAISYKTKVKYWNNQKQQQQQEQQQKDPAQEGKKDDERTNLVLNFVYSYWHCFTVYIL